MMTYERLEDLILEWATHRGILQNGDHKNQLLKLVSEIGEYSDEVAKNNHAKMVDELGDIMVVLIIMAELADIDPIGALAQAYNKIKDRKGYLNENGVFVKEE